MTELLEFKKDFPNVNCTMCRETFKGQDRLPPCDTKGKCAYTKDGEEPPTERLSAVSLFAWKLWNMKEALGMDTVNGKLMRCSDGERELFYELLFHIESEARRLGLKQPDDFMKGGV